MIVSVGNFTFDVQLFRDELTVDSGRRLIRVVDGKPTYRDLTEHQLNRAIDVLHDRIMESAVEKHLENQLYAEDYYWEAKISEAKNEGRLR